MTLKDEIMPRAGSTTIDPRNTNRVRESPATSQAAPPTSAPKTGDGRDLFATFTPRPGESLLQLLERAARAVPRHARLVSMTIFNGKAEFAAVQRELPALFGEIAWPVTWLESEASPSDAPAGIEWHAVTNAATSIRTLHLHDRVVGCAWDDDFARHCVLGDLRDPAVDHSAPEQTRRVIEDMIEALAQAGMTFRHVYRTWFRNRDILGWYHEFNQVRTDFFQRQKVFDGLLPASTGISAANPHGAALIAGLWAMMPQDPAARACVVPSPLQDSACRYGSSFSRAVEVDYGDHRHLTVSGTASIGPDGNTMHVGDINAQIDLTMRVVRAILNSRQMDWPDVVRGLVYCRHPEDIGAYARWAAAQKVTLPVIELNHTVCRDDLLYEIEVDACSSRPLGDKTPTRV